jgi:hypothetical protein
MQEWRLLDTPPMTAAENMALDEVLLELKGKRRTPHTIRYLQFKPRGVLVGFHQSVQEEIRVYYCRERGIDINRNDIEINARFKVAQVAILSLMGIPGTPLHQARPPCAEAVAKLIALARFKMPETPIRLGCARPRGNRLLEVLAVDAGVNRMALPSDEAGRPIWLYPGRPHRGLRHRPNGFRWHRQLRAAVSNQRMRGIRRRSGLQPPLCQFPPRAEPAQLSLPADH